MISTSIPGEWEAGVDGALAGYIMPAVQSVGDKWYSDFYSEIAEDEFEVLEVGVTHTIPPFQSFSGEFTEVVKTFDTTALDAESLENKYYAPGIGKISTDSLLDDGTSIGGETLVRYVVPELIAIVGALALALRRRR